LGSLSGNVKGQLGIVDSSMVYAFQIDVLNVDLMQLVPHMALDVAFDLAVRVSGQGTAVGDMRGEVDLSLSRAKVLGTPVQSVTLSGVLVWLTKKGDLRRWKDPKRGYLYVLNERSG